MKHTIYADLDSIVFEGREKDYGAFEMRKRYNRVLVRSSLIAFLLFIAVTGLPKVMSWLSPEAEELVEPVKPYVVETFDLPPPIPLDEDLEPPIELPPLEKNLPPPAISTIEFKVIEPAPKDLADDDASIRDMDSLVALDTAMIGFKDQTGIADDGTGEMDWSAIDGPGDGGPAEVLPLDDDPDPDAFTFTGEDPRPVNMNEVKELIGYRSQAVEAEIEGKVVVRILVDKTGKYKKHIVLKDPHPILTKSVEKQLHQLLFTPGIQGNKPVKVWVTIPFEFTLLH